MFRKLSKIWCLFFLNFVCINQDLNQIDNQNSKQDIQYVDVAKKDAETNNINLLYQHNDYFDGSNKIYFQD